jgi:NAD+ kinase
VRIAVYGGGEGEDGGGHDRDRGRDPDRNGDVEGRVDAVVAAAVDAGHEVVGSAAALDGGSEAVARGGRDASTASVREPDADPDLGSDPGHGPEPDLDLDPDVDALVTVGESAFLEVTGRSPSVPIVPIGAWAGPFGVSGTESSLATAFAALAAGEGRPVDHPVVAARLDGEPVARAATDVTLMTSDPARISEYALYAGGDPVASFRADGVVTATPLGSYGYARAVGGPVLGAGTGVAVVPVAPFATRTDSWVFSLDVAVSVERDDSEVSLYADDRAVRPLSPGDRVTVTTADHVTLLGVRDGSTD